MVSLMEEESINKLGLLSVYPLYKQHSATHIKVEIRIGTETPSSQ